MTPESPSTSSPSAAAPSPDWAAVDREILCPICDYNLRGLTESRCPECGHRFEWAEVLAHGGAVHPFLFEHRADQPIRSWCKTFWLSRFPWAFWRSVRPTHPVNMKRLLIYVLLCAVAAIVGAAPAVLARATHLMEQHEIARVGALKYFQSNRAATTKPSWLSQHGSPQAAVDAMYPKLTFPAALRAVFWNRFYFGWRTTFLPHSIFRLFLWPILTILSVLAFRISFRQAGVRYSHVARTIVYSADMLIVSSAVLAAGDWLSSDRESIWTLHNVYVGGFVAIPYIWIVMSAWLLIRMLIAERLYLRIRGGAAMVIASQVMVWLALAKISFMLQGH